MKVCWDVFFIKLDDFQTCTLPKDSGGCDNKIFRYYYNAIEVKVYKSLISLLSVFKYPAVLIEKVLFEQIRLVP